MQFPTLWKVNDRCALSVGSTTKIDVRSDWDWACLSNSNKIFRIAWAERLKFSPFLGCRKYLSAPCTCYFILNMQKLMQNIFDPKSSPISQKSSIFCRKSSNFTNNSSCNSISSARLSSTPTSLTRATNFLKGIHFGQGRNKVLILHQVHN